MSTLAIDNVDFVDYTWNDPNLRINWVGTGDTYHVRTRPTDGTTWSAVVTGTDDTGITIGGLTKGVHYEIEIVTEVAGSPPKIPGGSTAPDYDGYVVPSGVPPPTDVHITDETPTKVTVTWDKNSSTPTDALLWVDDMGVIGTMTDITGNTATIDNLNPNRFYKFYAGSVQTDEIVWSEDYAEKTPACCN